MSAAPIATAELIAIRPSGERISAHLRVGAAERSTEGGWSCEVGLDGLYPAPPPIHGEDSLQALCLAVGVVASLLREFVALGGRIEDTEGGRFPLEAYFGWFGDLGEDA